MIRKRKSKYNAKKAVIDDIKFDSEAEAKYYTHLKELKKEGQIKDFETQPEYELQPKFTNKKGKSILPIKYKADFLLIHNDGTQETIDVKGMETADFKIKKKLFEYKYDQSLTLVCEAPKYLLPQEWILLEELKELRKKRKKVTDKYGKKKSPEKERELQEITEEYQRRKTLENR
jgi:hypothetical protein